MKTFFKITTQFLCLFLSSLLAVEGIVSLSWAQTVLGETGLKPVSTDVFPPVSLLKGVKFFPDDPMRLDFIVVGADEPINEPKEPSGDEGFPKNEYLKLVKYFLASLAVPEGDLWVNLNPNEPDRIVSDTLGRTDMGRDLLQQDYILKQLASSLMRPDGEVGKKFWDEIYQKIYEATGSMNVPIEMLNRVWIVPAKAVVYGAGDAAYVVEAKLKVMLEEEYISQQSFKLSSSNSAHLSSSNALIEDPVSSEVKSKNKNGITAQDAGSWTKTFQDDSIKNILRQIIIPIIEREVNEGESFAALRQIYYSLILAKWFKKNLKDTLLGREYAEHQKMSGIDIPDGSAQIIYDQYLKAFQNTSSDLQESYDPATQQVVPRQYFSGGFTGAIAEEDFAQLSEQELLPKDNVGLQAITVRLDFAMMHNEEDVALWSQVLTDPQQHNPESFAYMVHALTDRYLLNKWNLNEAGISLKKGNDVEIHFEELYENPEKKLQAMTNIPTSFIRPDYRETWSGAGFVLKVPLENILSMSPKDAATPYAFSEKEVRNMLRNRQWMPPDQFIEQAQKIRERDPGENHTEINVVGTHPDTFSKVDIQAVFFKTHQGKRTMPKWMQRKLLRVAKRHQWPVIDIEEDDTSKISRRVSIKKDVKTHLFSYVNEGHAYVLKYSYGVLFEAIVRQYNMTFSRPMCLYEFEYILRHIRLISSTDNGIKDFFNMVLRGQEEFRRYQIKNAAQTYRINANGGLVFEDTHVPIVDLKLKAMFWHQAGVRYLFKDFSWLEYRPVDIYDRKKGVETSLMSKDQKVSMLQAGEMRLKLLDHDDYLYANYKYFLQDMRMSLEQDQAMMVKSGGYD